MDFQFSDEQMQLADSVRRYVDKEYDFERRKKLIRDAAAGDDVWATLAELGLLAIPLPEAHGGFGGGAVDLIGVMQAFGDALVVEPYVPTVVLGAGLVARAGTEAQQADLLPKVAEGSLKLAFAHTERDARYQVSRITTTAVRQGDGWVLTGEKVVVLGAPVADTLIVAARTAGGAVDASGIGLFLVDRTASGVKVSSYRTMDDMLAGDVRLDGAIATLLGSDAGGALPAIEATLDFATAVSCAEAVGAMDYANKATLEYLKTRKQFGVPIGSFQALQHRMVDMTIEAEQSRAMTYLACTSVNGERDAAERARLVSAAKVRVSDACRKVSQEAVQLHGGMGMTEELKVSHTFRRLTMLARRFGDADHHLQRFSATA